MKFNRRNFLGKSGLAGLVLTGLGFIGSKHALEPEHETESTAEKGNFHLLDWEPIPHLVVKETVVSKPKFPVMDMHNHLRDLDQMDEYLRTMNETGVWNVVSLDGHSADDCYVEHLQACQKVSRTRFNVFSYQVYYRFRETDDENIIADPSHHPQGRWRIYGLYLSDEVLEKIYNKNALKIFSALKRN